MQPLAEAPPLPLFAYGTLRPGHALTALAPLVDGLVWEGGASVSGVLYDLGPYPGAVLDAEAATRPCPAARLGMANRQTGVIPAPMP